MLVEKYQEKNEKLCFAFMDLKRTYDKGDMKGLWDVLMSCSKVFSFSLFYYSLGSTCPLQVSKHMRN